MSARKSLGTRVCRFWTRVFLRFIQFAASLVAYIALRTAGVSYQNTNGGQTVAVVVSSGIMSFARIINFLTFLYAFAFLVFVEWLRLCVHPVKYCEKAMDAVFLVALTVATLVLLLSGVTLHCRSVYGRFVRCGQVYLALVASFLSMLAFLCIVWIGHDEEDERRGGRGAPQGRPGSDAYSAHGTPRGGATPVPIVTAQPVQGV